MKRKRTVGWSKGWTNGWTNRWTSRRRTKGWTDECKERCIERGNRGIGVGVDSVMDGGTAREMVKRWAEYG